MAVILFLAWTLKPNYKKPAEEFKTSQEQKKEETSLTIGAKTIDVNGERKIALFIKPFKDFTLSAFSIRARVTQKGLTPKTKIEKSEKLSDAGWSFPMFKMLEDKSSSDSFIVEIAGFRLGNSPYTISSETAFAYLPIDQKDAKYPVSISIDREKTKFYASDATSKINY